MGKLRTQTAGSRLAIVLTTVIVTTVVLVGGVALATVGLNSVGSPEIQNGSIQSVDIGNGQVKTVDILNGTVRGLDIRDGTVTAVDLAVNAQAAGVNFAGGNQGLNLTGPAESVRSVVLNAPAAGYVIVTASGYTGFHSADYDLAGCSITDGAIAVDDDHGIYVDDFGNISNSGQAIPLSGTRTFVVPAGETTFRLVCREVSGTVIFRDSQITALYVPTRYA